MAQDGFRYDQIGTGYVGFRQPDPRIAAAVLRALGDARTVVNVGAGTGSYEPTDRPVVPVEPSTVMALQRPADRPPAVLGVAESLPFADHATDACMAILTMHHWSDIDRGLAELRRVARKRIVLLTIDVDIEADFWLLRDYVPQMLERDRVEFPSIDRLASQLQGSIEVTTVPIPADCADGFLLAFWNRPEAVLDPHARAATSGFARLESDDEAAAVRRLADDLQSGLWDERYGELRGMDELDAGLRLITVDVG